jgi:hypothetical protein
MPLPAQGAAAAAVCVVFPVKDLSPGTDARDYEQTITEAVTAAFQAGSFQVLPSASWQAAAAGRSIDLQKPISEPDAVGIARGLGASLAVTGIYIVQGDEIYYSIQGWNVETGKLAAAVQSATPFNLAFFSELDISLSTELIPRLSSGGPQKPRVTFVSRDEGMRVRLSEDQDIGTITEGKLSLPADTITPGTKVLLAMSKPGFHPADQAVTLTPGKDIPLKPLVREHRYGMELNSTLGQLLGLGAALRYYTVPDWTFFWFGSYLWVQPPLNLALRAVIHTDMFAGVGTYVFLNPDAPVRLGVSTGAGLILSVPTESLGASADFYLDVANWWLEAGLPGTTFYLRQEYKYALGIGTNLLGQGWMIKDFPPTTVGVLFRW